MFEKSNNSSEKETLILNLFFQNPTKRFNIREISRLIRIAPSTVSIYVKKLSKKGFIKEEKIGKFTYFTADIENEDFIFEKKIYNLKIIRDSELIKYLSSLYSPETIILYGSFARGQDIEESDIDIAIINPYKRKIQNLKKYESKLGRKIHTLEIKDISKIKHELLINIINGIIIYGKLKWF